MLRTCICIKGAVVVGLIAALTPALASLWAQPLVQERTTPDGQTIAPGLQSDAPPTVPTGGFLLNNGSMTFDTGRTVGAAALWQVFQPFTVPAPGWAVTTIGTDGWNVVDPNGGGMLGRLLPDVGGDPDEANPISSAVYFLQDNFDQSSWRDEPHNVNLSPGNYWMQWTNNGDTEHWSAIFLGVSGEDSFSRTGAGEIFGAGPTALRIGGQELGGCPGEGNCFDPDGNGTPGCNDLDCCEAVCALDPFCCDVEWDSQCAGEALDLCGNPACPGAGSCFEANGTPGCDDPVCCNKVCTIDPFCCDVEWDGQCANEAADLCQVVGPCPLDCPAGALEEGELCGDDINSGCDVDPPMFTDAACGDVFCGTAWADAAARDTDWYLVEHPGGVLSATVTSQFPAVCIIVDIGLPDCAALAVGEFGCSDDCANIQVASADLPAGTYAVFVAPGNCDGSGIFGGFPCGGGNNDYVLEINCEVVPPENDDCENPIPVPVPGSVVGFTNDATFDDFPFCGTSNTAPGIWYTVIGTGNTITATTCSEFTEYDTKISVYCGSCDQPICVSGNDDNCDPFSLASTVEWCSQEGAKYLVLVHGFGAATGGFELIVFDDGVACAGPEDCLPPDPCPWDLDGSGSVGAADLLDLLFNWGPCPGCAADFDGDDIVGASDLLAMLFNWGPCPGGEECKGQECGTYTFDCNPDDPECVCYTTAEGGAFCGETVPCDAEPCDADSDCPPGFRCAILTCCGDAGICIPECDGIPGPNAPAGVRTSTGR